MDLPPATAPDLASSAPLADAAALLDALPWGVLALDAQGVIQRVNQQAAAWCGLAAGALLGRPLAEAPLPAALRTALRQLPPEAAAPHEVWLPGTRQWLSVRAAPAPAGQRWVFLENATARHQAEIAQQRSSQLLLDMEEIAHTGSYEADLASGSFYFSDGLYRLFGEAPPAFVPTLAAIDARSHPDDAATVRQVLDEAVRARQPYTYRRRIRRADGAWRTLETHGAVVCDAAGQPVRLRGLVQDITERVQAGQQQRESHELLQSTIDSSLDLVQVFEAVRDEQGAVVDFTWVLNNAAAERLYGDVIGQRLCQLNPGVVAEGIFDTFRQVLETGVPDQRERHYVHEQFDGWFHQSTVQLGDGVATTTHDISARKQAEQELRETKELLQATLDSSHHVVQVLKAVRDEQGAIVDFTWVLTNQVWLKQYGGPMAGKSLLQENPGVVETGLFELFVQVTETGEPVDHEQYYAHEQFKAWFHQTLVRMGDGFVMNTIDITERKRAQEEIISLKEELAQQATDKYHALFQRMNQGFCVLEILFDAAGQQAVGFNALEVNPQFAQESGMAAYATGDTLRELVPALDDFWLAAYGQVVRTGEAQRLERYEPKVSRWFEVHAFPIGPPAAHQVAVLFTDISARKQAEQRQQYVMQLADALRPLADPLAIQREALAVLRAHLGGARTLYAEARDQEGTMYISTEDRDPGLVPMEGLVMRFQDFTPDGLAEAQAGQPLWRNDVLAEAQTPEQQAGCATFGTRAWLMVPLVKNGRLVADLTVHSATARAWTAHDIALVQETTERTWAAVERARAEEALRESEEKLRTVFDSIDEAFCLIDIVRDETGASVDYRLLEANHVFERQTGVANARGKLASEYVPGEEAYWLEQFDRVARTGEPARLENYHQATQHWYSAFAARIGSEGSNRVAIVFSDITARKRREQEQAFLLRFSDALRAEPTVDAVADRALSLLIEQLGLDRSYITTYYLDENRADVDYQLGNDSVPPLPDYFVLSDYPEAFKKTLQHTVVIEDDWERRGLSEAEQHNSKRLGMRAMVAPTLRKVNKPLWSLVVISARPRRWTPGEIALVEEAAERTWAALERARAEAALRESEEKYRTLFDSIDEGFALEELVYDANGEIEDIIFREVNRAYERQGGLTNVVGKSIKEVLPHLEQHWKDVYAQVARTGQPVRLINYAQDVNRWFDTYITLLGSSRQYVAVVFNDITERKQAEQYQQFLLTFSDALRTELTADAVALRALHLLSEQLGLDRCYTAEYHLEADHADIPHQVGNDRVPPLPAGGIRLSDFPEAFRVVFNQTLVIDDVAETAGLSATDRRNIGAMGLRALVAATLRQGARRPHWVIVAVSATPRHWTPGELALLEDVTERTWAAMERAKIEEALRASEAKLAAVFDALPVGIGLVDAHGRLTLANHQMRRYLPTGIMPSRDATQQRRWYAERPDGSPLPPTEFPGARAHRGEKVVPGVEMLHTPAEGPPVWTQVFAVPLPYRHGQAAGHVTAILDIDARKRAERQQAFLLKLSDTLRPLADADEIETAACRLLGEWLDAHRVYYVEIVEAEGRARVGKQYLRPGAASIAGDYSIDAFSWTAPPLRRGEAVVVSDVYHSDLVPPDYLPAMEAVEQRAIVLIPLVKNGTWVGTLAVGSDRPRDWQAAEVTLARETLERTWAAAERARTEQALAASEQRLRTLIANLPGAAAFVVGPDLRYQLAGGEALDAAGLGPADLLGRTVAEAMPPELVARYEAHYRQAQAGQHFALEHTAHGRTFISRGVPLLGAAGQPEAVLVVSYDITARKQAEEALRASQAQLAELNTQLEQRVARRTHELRENRDLLHAIAEALTFFVCAFKAVRDEHGHIVDLEYIFVNSAAQQQADGRPLVGRRYSEVLPGGKGEGFLPSYRRVIETGEQDDQELTYHDSTLTGWFRSNATKLGDGVLVIGEDITPRKRAEQERLKNLRLLEQAEAVAGLGSWDYDLATGAMRWSDGMYHLVNLPLGQPITPEVYLRFVVDDDRPRAEQLVRQLTSGQNAEQTLRLRVGEQVKTVRLKAVVLRDEAGRPARVLGVDLDISELQRLEADNLRLRLGQQQALFEAVQEAQEAERKRIAEGLHNGIGQILYATKLQLDRLPAGASNSPRHRAAQLLGEAIRQTRALSHELTPTILEEFGLEATLRSMCSTLSTPALRWHCHLVLDESPALPPALQLAVYRLAQELAQNVLKHAHATAATLEVEVLPAWVVLRVEDNGRGFDPDQVTNGLGMRTLRSRAALLGGSVQVATAPGQGTQCQVRLPLLS